MSAAIAPATPLAQPLGALPPESVIFGNSDLMRVLRSNLEKVAAANVPVLIQGESGTGKDILARLIHQKSPWRSGLFVKVNCPAIPGTLLESELFGYERGAFTGAYGAKPGRVEMAHRGTLFLDEISELDLSLQSKLLQLLQDGQFCRIGAQEEKRVEVRVVCATNRQLEQEMMGGGFRRDLFYRISVVNLFVPPLRDRRADIPHIAEYFLRTFNERYGRATEPLSQESRRLLLEHSWPGNIRELENVMKRYVIFGTEDIANELSSHSRPEAFQVPELALDGTISLKKIKREAMRDLERQVILKVLQAHRWNRKRTARALSISYRALLYKLKEVGFPGGKVLPQESATD